MKIFAGIRKLKIQQGSLVLAMHFHQRKFNILTSGCLFTNHVNSILLGLAYQEKECLMYLAGNVVIKKCL